jgi:hypothetical protein
MKATLSTTFWKDNVLLRAIAAMSAVAVILTCSIDARAPQSMAPAYPAAASLAMQERSFPIPLSLLEEHAELHTGLETAARLPGETGAAARKVLAVITPHFQDEQRRVYPLLRVLPLLGNGHVEPWMADLLPVADRLPAELDAYRRAHLTIDGVLDELHTAAWRENHQEYAFLADRIRRHEQMEQEICYPAALLVGECLRQRFPAHATASLR